MDASLRRHDEKWNGGAEMNPPRLIPLVLMLIVVVAIIYYMR
jgi:hypothetical protein